MVFHQRKRRGWSVWLCFFPSTFGKSYRILLFSFCLYPTHLSPKMAVVDASRDQLKLFPLGHTTIKHQKPYHDLSFHLSNRFAIPFCCSCHFFFMLQFPKLWLTDSQKLVAAIWGPNQKHRQIHYAAWILLTLRILTQKTRPKMPIFGANEAAGRRTSAEAQALRPLRVNGRPKMAGLVHCWMGFWWFLPELSSSTLQVALSLFCCGNANSFG